MNRNSTTRKTGALGGGRPGAKGRGFSRPRKISCDGRLRAGAAGAPAAGAPAFRGRANWWYTTPPLIKRQGVLVHLRVGGLYGTDLRSANLAVFACAVWNGSRWRTRARPHRINVGEGSLRSRTGGRFSRRAAWRCPQGIAMPHGGRGPATAMPASRSRARLAVAGRDRDARIAVAGPRAPCPHRGRRAATAMRARESPRRRCTPAVDDVSPPHKSMGNEAFLAGRARIGPVAPISGIFG